MKSIVFSNAGVIDARSIKTFGISAKTGKNPIGYFGTGLKYAIAILMREDCELVLWADRTRFEFSKKKIEQRGKEFEIIVMKEGDIETELPFTTELGKNWETWQAFRELYCNALDENGTVESVDEFVEPIPGRTTFIAKGHCMSAAYAIRHQIVLELPKKNRVFEGPVEIYNVPSEHIYYRGIRVQKTEKPALYTYNFFEEEKLTEDRTLADQYSVLAHIPKAVCLMKDRDTIRKILTAPKDYLESQISYWWVSHYVQNMSPEFLEVLAEEFALNNDALNGSARELQQKLIQASAWKNYVPVEMTIVEEAQLKKAKKAILKCFPDFEDYRILIVKDLGQQTMALADLERRQMVISRRAFALGTKYLTATMIEEYLHLKTGYGDCTRELQTHLFDSICSIIENHVIGEPL